MKTKFNLLLACAAAALLSGCALFESAVPTTCISGEIGGQSFKIKNPKQTEISDMTVEISTNGTAKLSIKSLKSLNDSNVIESAYSGQTSLVNAGANSFSNGLSTAKSLFTK